MAAATTETVSPNQANFMPSQHAQEQASEALTSSLMDSVQVIMERAQAEGRDPDAELREVVSRAVMQGMVTGYDMGNNAQDAEHRGGEDKPEQNGVNGSKRSRTDDGLP